MRWLSEALVLFISVTIGVAASLLAMVIISGLIKSFLGG